MQTPESSTLLDLLGRINPWILAVVAVIFVAVLVAHSRSRDPLTPVRPMDPLPGEDEGGYTLEDFRKDYNPDDKWNRAPGNHDRL